MRHLLVICFLLALTLVAFAFNETVNVQLVNVYLAATDGNNRFVKDLQPHELLLRENGELQTIVDLSNYSAQKVRPEEKDLPLTLSFLLDISGSMAGSTPAGERKIDSIKKAAHKLLDELNQDDKMNEVGFDRLPKPFAAMTSEKTAIANQISLQQPESADTALYDSLYMTLDKMRDQPGRKIIVVGSDGRDTASHLRFEELLESLRGTDITLLVLGIPSIDFGYSNTRYVLGKLAEVSGGYAFFASADYELSQIMQKLRESIRSQYSVWYTPKNAASDGSWRNIQINCKRPGVELRYREGYYAK
ncbi:MAG TPA: VWA domain-containing protein [Acidobacteriota bacterium]|nr:VWA domain-containing protein [Acidobacteriota bacterium]